MLKLKTVPYEPPFNLVPDAKPLGVADAMGIIYVDLELQNGVDLALLRQELLSEDKVRKVTVRALVDTGCMMLAINEKIRDQLGLSKVDERAVELAGGSVQNLEVVGPVEVSIPRRRCNVDALVLPGNTEPLLGAIPMEDMDLWINPKAGTIQVDPSQPYLSRKLMK